MLQVKNLTKIYRPKRGVPVTALNSVDLTLPETGMVFLLGKSGSGKSTLLNILGGLDRYNQGDILVMDNEGEDVYVITYAAKDASGASVTGNAIFNAGGYVCDEEELEGITDRLEAMVDGETDRDRAQELRTELMEYLGLSVCVSYCRLNVEYETVSGAYVAEQLGVQYE